MANDILLDEENDMLFQNGDFVLGNSEMQDVGLILQSNQGAWKENPVLGPNLVELSKTNISRLDIEKRVRVHLALDNKDYNAIKRKIELNTIT